MLSDTQNCRPTASGTKEQKISFKLSGGTKLNIFHRKVEDSNSRNVIKFKLN